MQTYGQKQKRNLYNVAVVILLVAFLWLLVFLSLGCHKETTVDPNTGETETTWRVDPNKADQGEAIADAVVGAGGLASAFLPWLTPFVAAGAAGDEVLHGRGIFLGALAAGLARLGAGVAAAVAGGDGRLGFSRPDFRVRL